MLMADVLVSYDGSSATYAVGAEGEGRREGGERCIWTYKIPSMKMILIVSFRLVASWSFQREGSGNTRIPTSMRMFVIPEATK